MIGKVDGHIEENNGNKRNCSLQMKTKKYQKNLQNFGMESKMKLRQEMVVKKVNMVKIL